MAARQSKDLAGHSGLIVSGSTNVLIGGFPAARQGDGFVCPAISHKGGGAIMSGSSTVFINGKPAARMGDKTMCGVPPIPAPIGVTPAEKKTLVCPMARNIDFVNDGYIHSVGVSGDLTDEDKDGSYDTFSFDAPLIFDLKSSSVNWEPLGEGNGSIGGNLELSVGHGMVRGSLYAPFTSKGTYGREVYADITGVHHGATIHGGKEGVWEDTINGYWDVGYAEAYSTEQVICDFEGKRYGIQYKSGASAGKQRLGLNFSRNILGILKYEGNIEPKLVSIGAGAGCGCYVDFDDFEINVNASGELALLLGINGELSVTLSLKPIVEFLCDFLGLAASKDGEVLTGCPTVLIGD